MEEFDQKIPLNSKKTYENDSRFSKCVCTVRNFHAQFGRFVRFKYVQFSRQYCLPSYGGIS